MKRRELIQLVTLSTGAVLSAPLLGSLVSGCTQGIKKKATDYQNLFFTKDDFTLIQELVDIILPRSESPSATDVGVHITIDTMIAETYSKEDQDSYQNNFNTLQKFLRDNDDFKNGNKNKKTTLLKELSDSKGDENSMTKRAFLDIRQQTIAYYLSTEKISKNYLNYLPIPGKYESCISVDEVNNTAWAL